MSDFAEPWWDLNIIGENDPNKNDYEPAYSPDNDPYYTIFGDDDDDRPFYELGTYVVDEEDLGPEERPHHIEISPSGLQIYVDDGPDPEPEPAHHKEEPDINGIYCFYEESEFY